MIEAPERGQRVKWTLPLRDPVFGEVMFVNHQDRTAIILFDGYAASDRANWDDIELAEEPMGFTAKEKSEILAVLKRAHVIRLKAGSDVVFVVTTDEPLTMDDVRRIGEHASDILRQGCPNINVKNVLVLGSGMSLGAIEVTDIPKIKVQSNAKS